MLTLEGLLTSPVGFNLGGATPVQRAICRVSQGLPLGELATHPLVVKSLGGPEAVETYEGFAREGTGWKPLEVFVVAAIRTGKSLIAGAASLHGALTLPPPPGMKRSEEAWVPVTSLSVKTARVVGQHLLGALQGSPVLRRLLVPEPKPNWDAFVIRRPDGYKVRFLVAAGRKGGANLVSRWNFGTVFDEAARMQGQEDGIINFDDAYQAVSARLSVIGAQLFVVSSPWLAHGPVYDAVKEDWGKPTRRRIVIRATGPEMNPATWTPEACERERLNPNGSYETDVLGEFADPQAGWVTAKEVQAATRKHPEVLLFEPGVDYFAAIDPATAGNAWTLVVVGRWPDEEGREDRDRFRIALAQQWQGTSAEPLRARDVFADMAPTLKDYRINEVHTDRWGGSLIVEIGDLGGLTVTQSRDAPEEKARAHADFRTLLLDGRLELAPVEALAADLLSTRKKLTPGGGVKYEYPITRDRRHADYAPAAVLAVARARSGPSWVSAMEGWRRRGGVL